MNTGKLHPGALWKKPQYAMSVALTMLMCVVSAIQTEASAAMQSREQRICINRLSKAALRVAIAFRREARACMEAEDEALEQETLDSCIRDKRAGAIATAIGDAVVREYRYCTGSQPDFGYQPAAETGLFSMIQMFAAAEAAIGTVFPVSRSWTK